MKKIIFSFFIICLAQYSFAQLHGGVYDAVTKKPVADANVFLSGTLFSAVTDTSGLFVLKNTKPGTYDLIVTMVGYETAGRSVSGRDTNYLSIFLIPKTNKLNEVIVNTKSGNGWKKWGHIFSDNFIGTTLLSRDCKILNYDKIKFTKSDKEDVLRAFCSEPLIIENKALGYHLKYKLESFQFNLTNSTFIYAGYPYFEEIAGSDAEKKKWKRNRLEAYQGSMLHFMRALFNNTLQTEGFEIDYEIKQTALAKAEDMKLVLKGRAETANIVSIIDSNNVVLAFPEYLHVVYTKKIEPAEYFSQNGMLYQRATPYTSDMMISHHKKIIVMGNGSYVNPKDLVLFGYWAWSDKLCSLLPFDYVPD